jgi:hypothetical protein
MIPWIRTQTPLTLPQRLFIFVFPMTLFIVPTPPLTYFRLTSSSTTVTKCLVTMATSTAEAQLPDNTGFLPCGCPWKECPLYFASIKAHAPTDHPWNGPVFEMRKPATTKPLSRVKYYAIKACIQHRLPGFSDESKVVIARHHYKLPQLNLEGVKIRLVFLSKSQVKKIDNATGSTNRYLEKFNQVDAVCRKMDYSMAYLKPSIPLMYIQPPLSNKQAVHSFVSSFDSAKSR